jgi:hypothetical protein
MSDTAIAEPPAEPAPLAPPAPEATAELEAALVSTVDTSPSPLEAVEAPGATAPEQRDATAPQDDSERRGLPFDVDHLGLLRRAVLDHLVDTDEPQSVAQILAAMPPGTTRGNVESAIKRNFDAGLIERVGAGLYVLGKPKPPKPAEPTRPSPVA